MTLVIMAAGMGSRFGGLKQIEPVGPNGEFIIDYSIYDAIQAGFNKVVFIIKEENYEIFKETIGKRIEGKIDVEYVFQDSSKLPEGIQVPEERKKPLGTGHALYCAIDSIKDSFAVISADDFYGREPFQLLKESLKEEEYSVIGYKIGNTIPEDLKVKRGVCFEENGIITSIIESEVLKNGDTVNCKPLLKGDEYTVDLDHPVSMLMYGLQLPILDYLKQDISVFLDKNKADLLTVEYLLPQILDDFSKKNNILFKLIPTNAVWRGITYKSELEEIKNYIKTEIENGVYPRSLY